MKKTFPFWFLLLLSCAKLFGQNNLPPAYEIKADTSVYETLDDDYWQVLEEKEGKWEISQVIQPPVMDLFHSDATSNDRIDYRVHFYWLRYSLKNIMQKEAKICLINSTNADQSDFFVSDKNMKWLHYTTGYLYPIGKKDGLKKIDAIPIILEPGEEKFIYNRIRNYYYFNKPDFLSVKIGNTANLIQENYISNANDETTETILSSLFAGVLLCSCFVNLFFYITVKEKVFVYYILFLIYFSIEFYTYFFTNVFFKNSSPAGAYFILVLVKAFGIPLFVQFLRHFLKVYKTFPSWDKLLKIISILSPLAFIASFFIEPYLYGKLNGFAYTSSRFFFVLGLYMILLTLLFYRKNKDRLIRLLIISALPASLFWVFGFTITDLYAFLAQHYNISSPPLVDWLNTNFGVMNIASVMWLAISFSWILVLRFIQLRKENAQQALDKERIAKEKERERSQLIEQQKNELEKKVEERTSELKHSLENLQSAQKQLIQSEKMASLGELTAGIAHEIQNPLNFVNNFSEVNKELIDELKNELATGNQQLAMEIADDIKSNEEKINHHGKRADAIVKGMLQHSRSSTGVKEPTNINALADEYLRLSYLGLRAKDKDFNAEIKTDFDKSIDKINIIPQDIGRVLLNLFNNAFYAVNEQKNRNLISYEPTVSVSTKKVGDKVEIKVSDNGNGIPQKVVDKIFQPFFTTKPTGQGTGLGLSLSYDIIKAHGGEIKVGTKEGHGSEFIIQLSIV